MCGICESLMGPNNSIQSLQVVCCSDGRWYHKTCLKQLAFTLNDDFDCPTCDNRDQIRQNMQAKGIFIRNGTYIPKPVDTNKAQESKRHRIHKNWIREKTFSTKSKALVFVEAEMSWLYSYLK